jgi:hypothetical protein
MAPNNDSYEIIGFCTEQEFVPLLDFLIRHPVIIPPIDELNNTYELEEEKNPVTWKSQLGVSDNAH